MLFHLSESVRAKALVQPIPPYPSSLVILNLIQLKLPLKYRSTLNQAQGERWGVFQLSESDWAELVSLVEPRPSERVRVHLPGPELLPPCTR